MKHKEIIRRIREIHPAIYRLYLRFDEDCIVEVLSDTQDIIKELSLYFDNFIIETGPANISITAHEINPEEINQYIDISNLIPGTPEPGKRKIKEEYIDLPDGRIVRKRLTDMIFVFGQGENLAAGPCLKNINQVVNFINNRHIESRLCKGCLLGHAAGVVINGKGLALAGFAGAGKSTLALHLMRSGASFVSNDRLMIEKKENGLFMYGIAKLPRINPGTILNNPNLAGIMSDEDYQKFSALSRDELWKVEYKYDASIDKCFGQGRFIINAPMHSLVILNWKSKADSTISKKVDIAQRRDLLPAVMKNTGLFFLPHQKCRMPEPTIENYIEHLKRCDVLEISGKIDFEAAAAACISFLRSSNADTNHP